jgi:hypothetical protein
MNEIATYTVEASWENYVMGIFTLDSSLLDGTDVLAADFGATAYDDITDAVKRIEIERGRAADGGMMDAGTCRITLHDATGKYNPTNAAGALYGKLKPLRPVRVYATYGGAKNGLFQGYISSIEHNPSINAQETVIEAIDMFEILKRCRVTVAEQTDELVSDILGEILEACKIPNRFKDMGKTKSSPPVSTHTVPSYSCDATRDALSDIEDLMMIDQGVFFISKTGLARYLPHTSWYAGASVATITDSLAGHMRSGISLAGIVNRQIVTREGGEAQTANDTTSQDDYGICAGAPITSPYIDDDAQALALAEFIVGINAQPRPPVRRVSLINSTAANMAQIMAREIGHIVTVSETHGGTSVVGPIESIAHEISDGMTIHRCRMTVRPHPASVPDY